MKQLLNKLKSADIFDVQWAAMSYELGLVFGTWCATGPLSGVLA